MQYGFGYSHIAEDGKKEVIVLKHISEAEYEKHLKNLEFCRHYNHLKNIYSLVINNGKSFLKFSEVLSDNPKADEFDDDVGLEGNRLLINYLTSIGMFIDYGEKEMSKALGKDARNEFRKKTNELYDRHLSYRFLVLMRDYVVHYSFPLHTHVKSLIEPSGLFAQKSNLLRYKKWKHAKADIEKMPSKINLYPHVIEMQKYISELFNFCLLKLSSKLVDVIQYANDLIQAADRKNPIFISFENEEKYRAGQFSLHPVELESVYDAYQDLKNHPNIIFNDKNQKEELETILEFYYNDELIMNGPTSFFKEVISNPTNPNDTDITLSLGDRFTMDDFPNQGDSTRVRVIRMVTQNNFSKVKPTIIKYFLESYDNY
ncbi:hypothetical protein [Ornithinibacillus sp. FSL M8-0202]|uniref:hypothetical protein n=1 Tax=Ornithinibacillus sp. FSL M8-0202 TaxID=2921616 RepID=UPI0030CE553D